MASLTFCRGLPQKVAFAATIALFGTFSTLDAQAQTTLTLSSYSPTTAWSATRGLATWIANVEEATEGRVRVRLMESPLGPPAAHFDLARDGIADVTFGVMSYTPARFVVGGLGSMPGAGATGRSISVALWRFLESTPEFQQEFDGVKVLSLSSTSPQQVFAARGPIESVSDFEGLKVRVPGGLVSAAVEALGATPVLQPSGKAYELLSTGILDGIAFPQETIIQFNLEQLIRYSTFLPGGVGAASLFLVMNEAKFNSLPPEDQEAIMSVSGEVFGGFYGSIWDERDALAVDQMRAAGIEITEQASDEMLAEARERLAPIETIWLDEVAQQRNADGPALLQRYREILAEVEQGS